VPVACSPGALFPCCPVPRTAKERLVGGAFLRNSKGWHKPTQKQGRCCLKQEKAKGEERAK